MDIRKLQRAIVDGLEDVKAQHIVVFNTEHLSPLFERVIIASGTSNRQTRALAASVRDAVRKSKQPVLSVEGEDNGEWIIVDCGAAVAHIMQPTIRDYYRLEEIWGGKPVRMKLADETPQRLPKAGDSSARATTAKAQPARPAASSGRAAAAWASASHKPAAKKRASPKKPSAPRSATAKAASRGRTTVESGRVKAAGAAAKAARPAAKKARASAKTAAPRKAPRR